VAVLTEGPLAAAPAAAVGAALGASVVLTGSPGTPVIDAATHTLYVPIQSGSVLDVVNDATCNANLQSGCRVVATAAAGGSPLAAAVDERTDTVYITNAGGTVTVLDGARCNAIVQSGCGKDLATIQVGGFLVDAAFDPRTRTLYVANPQGGSVFVVNVAKCNTVAISGCASPVKKVKDSYAPQSVDIDLATDTVYAANNGTGNGDTVSVIDGVTCNATHGSGCRDAPRIVKVGNGAFWDAVDQANDTVYVANNNDGTVSVINGGSCNAMVTSGCGNTPPVLRTGAGAATVAVDGALHTLFTVNANDDTLAEVNTKTCNGGLISGCPAVALNEQAVPDQGPGSFPNTVVLAPPTNTAYLVNVGGPNILSVISVGTCNAIDTSGCRAEAPSVPDPEDQADIDPATNTIYASNDNLAQIDVINAATCDVNDVVGCAPLAKIPMGHPAAAVGAIDDSTHTLYASDSGGNVSVINTATCNATNTAGCAGPWPSINIGTSPGASVFDSITGTLYVPFGSTADEIAVLNAATCNAEVSSGCGQSPGTISVPGGTYVLGLSEKTDTVYAPNEGFAPEWGDTVSVIDGATCNGADLSGCGHVAATITVGLIPDGIAVDDATNTAYVANNRDGDQPGTVSVINSATCNGADTAGCSASFPTVGVGRSPRTVGVDATTDMVYVADHSSAAISAVNGASCNAEVVEGCGQAAPEQGVGSQPDGLVVAQSTGTVYVMNSPQAGSMSIIGG
jgi:DNA-binding beta-propeller fold protein YncE